MKKACLVVSPPYLGGEIFNRQNTRLNRDDCLAFFHELQEAFAKAGVSLSTQDLHRPDQCEFVIYNEMPKVLPVGELIQKSYLLLFESELIRPDNWVLESHRAFSKVFTWHDDYVDNKKYFKMNFTHAGQAEFLKFGQKTQFCTLIAGDKVVQHPLELYSERRKAIRWFERWHPEQFAFFGVGWDEYTFKGPKMLRALNRLKVLRRALAEKWPSYRGRVDSKLSTLRKYKFAISYENARDIPGYITEKIFDCFASGCVPVYWGAPNIAHYVPKECFIDKREFKTYEDLYAYLEAMTESEYDERLAQMHRYLRSPSHEMFAPLPVAKSVAAVILGAR